VIGMMLGPARSPAHLTLYAPFAILVLVLVVHAIYWNVISRHIHGEVEAWIGNKTRAGYMIDHQTLKVGGYPFRFTIHMTHNDLTAPESEDGWRIFVDQWKASAQFYNLNHWIITLGEPVLLDVRLGGENTRYALTFENARFSVVTRKSAIDQLGAEATNLVVTTETGSIPPVSRIERLALAARVGEENVLFGAIELEGLALNTNCPEPWMRPASGDTIRLMQLDSTLTNFNALVQSPLVWARTGGHLAIRQARLDWGSVTLTSSGDVTLDCDGRPEGQLSVMISNPESLLSIMENARLIHDEHGAALLKAMMAAERENAGTVLLRIQDGGLFMNSIQIGGSYAQKLVTGPDRSGGGALPHYPVNGNGPPYDLREPVRCRELPPSPFADIMRRQTVERAVFRIRRPPVLPVRSRTVADTLPSGPPS